MLDVQDTVAPSDSVADNGNGNGNGHSGVSAPAYRIDQKLHQILYKEPERPKFDLREGEEGLPEPVYPQHPDPVERPERKYRPLNAPRTWKTGGKPYFASRWHSKELRPI